MRVRRFCHPWSDSIFEHELRATMGNITSCWVPGRNAVRVSVRIDEVFRLSVSQSRTLLLRPLCASRRPAECRQGRPAPPVSSAAAGGLPVLELLPEQPATHNQTHVASTSKTWVPEAKQQPLHQLAEDKCASVEDRLASLFHNMVVPTDHDPSEVVGHDRPEEKETTSVRPLSGEGGADRARSRSVRTRRGSTETTPRGGGAGGLHLVVPVRCSQSFSSFNCA